MKEISDTRIPPSLVRGKVKRAILLPDGKPLVQVWRWHAWQPDDGSPSTLAEVAAGVSVPTNILRVLGIPASDWDTSDDTESYSRAGARG